MARVIASATPLSLTFIKEGTLDMARNTNAGTFCCVTRRETNENILREELKKATRFCLLFVKASVHPTNKQLEESGIRVCDVSVN
jgi:hypothetical protein